MVWLGAAQASSVHLYLSINFVYYHSSPEFSRKTSRSQPRACHTSQMDNDGHTLIRTCELWDMPKARVHPTRTRSAAHARLSGHPTRTLALLCTIQPTMAQRVQHRYLLMARTLPAVASCMDETSDRTASSRPTASCRHPSSATHRHDAPSGSPHRPAEPPTT